MSLFLEQYFSNKKVLILGFGREGRSTYNYLQRYKVFSKLAIADKSSVNIPLNDDITVITGDSYLDILDDYDVVIKSPGIPLRKQPSEYTCCITSQIELFLNSYSQQTIGITGTKGKSTTSSLLYHILKESGVDCVLAGNIGIPVFDIIDDITDATKIVLELSCHQLEYVTVSPSISVLLNLYEDHLDRYGTFEVYSHIKRNIYRFQNPEDILFCNSLFLPTKNECHSQVRAIHPHAGECIKGIKTNLKGFHNRYNIAVVYEICKHLNICDTDIITGVSSFKPLRHRLEYLGTIDGVDYYNDSISTTVESTIGAIKSIENIGTVLIGGMDRGIDYEPLIDFLLTCCLDHVIFMYDSGKHIYDRITRHPLANCSHSNYIYFSNLEESVKYAQENTASGKACVLSPAAASYGVFKDFEDRGNAFRKLLGFG